MKIGTLYRGIRLGSVCALLATFAAAEDPPLPVSVSFKFRDASIREGPATEAMLSEMLAKSLQERYKFWKFQTVSAASPNPQIQFWLRRNQEWDLHMNLTAQQGDPSKGEWKEKLFSPEDMTLLGDMLPRDAGWKPEIKRAFESRLLEANKDKILKALRYNVRLCENV